MLYKPLKYFIIYILFTMLISFFGPLEYRDFNKMSVTGFMFVFILFFIIAYFIGIELASKIKPYKRFENIEKKTMIFTKASIMITFILSFWSFIDFIFKHGFALRNLGQAYVDLYTGFVRNSGRNYSLLELFTMFTGILKQGSIVLGLYYYKKLSKIWRILLIFSWGLLVFSTIILTGKQKIIGDITIYILSVYAVIYSPQKLKAYRKYLLVTLLIVAFLLTYILKERYEAIGINVYNYNEKTSYHVYMNEQHILYKIFGDKWGFPISILLTSYLAGGYYGLSLCLDTPFQWTYGLGHSYSLAVIANRFLGFPFYYTNGYVFRMEQLFGWPAWSKWHTVFPYLASDLTFFGSLIFFFFIALIYSAAYLEASRYKNPVSLLLFSSLNIMLVFVPANNQLMIAPENYFAYIIILFFWIFFHKRYNII